MNGLLAEATALVKQLRSVVKGADQLSFDRQLDPAAATSTLYEVYVSLQALLDLQARWRLRLSERPIAGVLRLPLSHALKENFPFFYAEDQQGNVRFQVCIGTKVFGSGDSYAPDLSLQLPDAPNKPTGEHVVFVWDHKYMSDQNEPLNRDEVSAMSGYVRLIGPQAALSIAPFAAGTIWSNKNTIITNGKHSSLNEASLAVWGLEEISELGPGLTPTKRP